MNSARAKRVGSRKSCSVVEIESVPVHEKHDGSTVWAGELQVFAVEHPKAIRVYAWSHETVGGRRRFHAGAQPVDGAVMAVETAVLAEAEHGRHEPPPLDQSF